jgi:hypothetical protein
VLKYLFVISLLLSSLSFAEKSRISLQGFEGKGATRVRKQMKKKLCTTYRCVERKPGKSVEVDAVVYGAVAKGRLQLTVATDPGEPSARHEVSLNKNGTLRPAQVQTALAAVDSALTASVAEASLGE